MAEIVTFDRIYLGNFELTTVKYEQIYVPVYCSKLSGVSVEYVGEQIIGWNREDVKGYCSSCVVEAMDRLEKVTNGKIKPKNTGRLYNQQRA